MVDISQSIILGIVQGASEFLPISSSGHLILMPHFFGWDDSGLTFDVALHFGTLLAVTAFFWRDWLKIISAFSFQLSAFSSKKKSEYPPRMLWILVVATVPGALAGFFLKDLAETFFRNPSLIAFNLALWGLVLYVIDKKSKRVRNLKEISFVDGIIVGLAQALAVIPGTSRSGITISAALALGLDRVSAARFSFLMLTPIVFGASLSVAGSLVSGFNTPLLLGIFFSAISGYLAIKYLLRFVERASYAIFFWYRLALALAVFAVAWL